MADVVDPATTTTFTKKIDCIITELDLINRQPNIHDHRITEMEWRVSLLTRSVSSSPSSQMKSFLPRSVPLLPPPHVVSPLPPNAHAALPPPPPHVTAHHPPSRFPASNAALPLDIQRPCAPNIARRILVDPLHGQQDGDAPTPRHLLHLRASLLDTPLRHGAIAIFVPPSSSLHGAPSLAPNARPPPPPTAPKCPPATLPLALTSGATAFGPDWTGNTATDS
jgi:hypothetical protein